MADQCTNCGGYNVFEKCQHCSNAVCGKCKLNHEPYCEEIQKRKRRGEGPTIANVGTPSHRPGHAVPETTEPDRRFSMPAILGAPYDLSKQSPSTQDSDSNRGNEAFVDIYAHVQKQRDDAAVNQQQDAVKGLLEAEAAQRLERLPKHTILSPTDQADIDAAIDGIAGLLEE